MWVTSLPGVRTKNFELFFYTHQLYVVFVIFLALHVGDFIFLMGAGGIFLFILDRFLRFIQSRKTVDVISATSLPCGTVELVLSKPACKCTYSEAIYSNFLLRYCLLYLKIPQAATSLSLPIRVWSSVIQPSPVPDHSFYERDLVGMMMMVMLLLAKLL